MGPHCAPFPLCSFCPTAQVYKALKGGVTVVAVKKLNALSQHRKELFIKVGLTGIADGYCCSWGWVLLYTQSRAAVCTVDVHCLSAIVLVRC